MVKCGRLHQDEVQSPVRKTEDIKIEGRFGEGAVGTGLGLWSGAGGRGVKTGYKGEAKRGFSRQFSGIYFLHPTDSFETSTLKEKSNCSIRPQVSLSFFVLDERCSIFLLRMSTVSEGRESSKPMETPPTLQKPGGANTRLPTG
jgi:hypothetical protein